MPDIACAHHETLTGTGYPFRLTGAQLPIQARILAVADIFEALTASDRPYAKAKPLSQALEIMASMRRTNQIDPDIFDIFLKSGVYLDYARKYLAPEQLDIKDVSTYLETNLAES